MEGDEGGREEGAEKEWTTEGKRARGRRRKGEKAAGEGAGEGEGAGVGEGAGEGVWPQEGEVEQATRREVVGGRRRERWCSKDDLGGAGTEIDSGANGRLGERKELG